MQTDFAPRDRSSYRFWTTIPIRFADQDILGHVNNAAIAIYLEHARCLALLPLIERANLPDINIVLARIIIDYLREIRYPGSVDVGIRITKRGSKSIVVSGAVFLGDDCCVVSEATIVFFDLSTRRSAVPPDSVSRGLDDLT